LAKQDGASRFEKDILGKTTFFKGFSPIHQRQETILNDFSG